MVIEINSLARPGPPPVNANKRSYSLNALSTDNTMLMVNAGAINGNVT